ncbi:hypothetical protein BKA67DRAFT_545197 [Truncatella angustata]|uniref:Uncharacterized protein n=1 Tax=Truncatella angustata TaxID=152316 RepID=A0A9P9A1K3_9PEZI|nr:uncharacterized protein BKA67DRAFT_545197 [Truncatella angustata]KAH6659641.1 hypothetical protein BKA67DRAFT_545197 [Truncatella angustata]
MPPPPPFKGGKDQPPHGPVGDHHGPPPMHGGPHHGGPPSGFNIHHPMPILRISAIIVTLGLLFAALHTRCFTARRKESHQSCMSRRRECRAAHRTGFAGFVQRVRFAFDHHGAEDEEKEAMMRQVGEEDTDSDAMSTTMEQDIEQFRNAANIVSDMVAAEEGRSPRGGMVQYSTIPVPPSPHTAFADYMVLDEALPAYDEAGSNEGTFVSDGMRFSESSTYAPSVSSAHSSLDENLGRKE